MRLVVDLQACQTDSRDRGIGRYAMNFVQAIASELDKHDELIIAIDLADACRVREVRNELRHRRVRANVMGYAYPTTQCTDASPAARRLAGQMRSRFYASLLPDALVICSLFEYGTCFSTESDWPVLEHIPTAVIGHDLIPLLFPSRYLPEGHFFTDWYRMRLGDLQQFDLILSNSESTKRDLVSHLGISDHRIAVIGAGLDETLACPYDNASGQQYLRELGIRKSFVLMVGNGDWRKNTLGALRAFADLPEPLRDAHELVLTQAGDDVKQALEIEYAHLRDQVHILGRVSDAILALLYRECRVVYFPSYYEGFGFPVLEAMALNAPVLTSSAGALPEVAHDPRSLFDASSLRDGVALLTKALVDDRFCEDIRRGAREHALTFTWKRTAQKAINVLRALAGHGRRRTVILGAEPLWPGPESTTLMADTCIETGETGECALEVGLRAIARADKRRVLVDISEIVRLDARTGIQRVTRNFFTGLAAVSRNGGGFEVEPFCWTEQGIRYARDYARNELNVPCSGLDETVEVQPSDIVFMLDSSWWSPERFDDFHARTHAAGGEVIWMVYDLVPIRFPETCDPGMPPAFAAWLTHAAHTTDGFVCISDATRSDLEAFMDGVIDTGARRPWARSVHLGCDLDPAVNASPSGEGAALLAAVGTRPYFMGLGTVEPRKDYNTIIDAFELMWARGLDVVLVVIGKQGWHVDSLAKRIDQHPEHGQRLFWLRGAGDGDVRFLLERAAALIQASVAEGFGLPLIEAGSLGVPLLVSDIGVFHEIAGDEAVYFPVGDVAALADAAVSSLSGGLVRTSARIRCRSWQEVSVDLADVLGVTSHADKHTAEPIHSVEEVLT